MKTLLILAAYGCIWWLCKVLIGLHGPLSLEIYLGLLGGSYLLSVIQHIVQTEYSYWTYYVILGVPLCLLSVGTAVRWIAELGIERGLLPLMASVVAAFAFGWLIDSEVPRPKFLATDILLSFGWCFCVAGLLSLASAVIPLSAVQFRLRVGFGIFWLLSGVYYFCDALGVFRARALWDSISGYASQVLCIVCLGGLAFLLSRQQRELVRQSVTDELVMQEVGQ